MKTKFQIGDFVKCTLDKNIKLLKIIGYHATEKKKNFYYKCEVIESITPVKMQYVILAQSHLKLCAKSD